MFHLFRQTNVSLSRRGQLVSRRTALKSMAAGAGALSFSHSMALHAEQLRKQEMACIVLWMQGGPSQFETFSPLPDHANGGGTKAIATSVGGIHISEYLPHTAKAMEDICVIRSMTSKEGSHPRATFLMQTGYLPNASVKHPALGAHASMQLGNPDSELPEFVRIGRARINTGGGLLGVEHNPFVVQTAGQKPENAEMLRGETAYRRRTGLLSKLDAAQALEDADAETREHQKLYEATRRMTLSPKMSAFELDREPEKVRQSYGESTFGAGCLLARRLVEAGVTYIEVSAGNWDTHFDNAERTQQLCTEIDQPYAALLADLKQRGMLDRTMVVWMGEFGRTPRINARGGRDHYPRAFNVTLAGGGVRGGQVIGTLDQSGSNVTDRPVSVPDLLQTICHSLKIDADQENLSGIGRPIRVVDGGSVVNEAFG